MQYPAVATSPRSSEILQTPVYVSNSSSHGSPSSNAFEVVTQTPMVVNTTDVCSVKLTPALRAWIENLVRAQLDNAMRPMREADAQLRAQVAYAQSAAQRAQSSPRSIVQVDQSVQLRLEADVRRLAESQARMQATVSTLTGDHQQQARVWARTDSQAKAMSLAAIEEVMGTIEDLRRSFEKDSERHAHAAAELRRSVAENSVRDRSNSQEAVELRGTVTSLRKEVGDLRQMFLRINDSMASLRSECVSDVTESVINGREAARLKSEASVNDKVEEMKLQIQDISNWCGEVSARENRAHESLQSVTRRLESMQQTVNGLGSEEGKEIDNIRRDMVKLRTELVDVQDGVHQRLVKLSTEIRSETRASLEAAVRSITESDALVSASMVRETTDLRQQQSFEEMTTYVEDRLAKHHRKVSGEIQAESRASVKKQQDFVAALDEQLWLTDSRLGRRIDEIQHLVHAAVGHSASPPPRHFDRGLGEQSADISGVTRARTPERDGRNGSQEAFRGGGGVFDMARKAAEAFDERAGRGSRSTSPEAGGLLRSLRDLSPSGLGRRSGAHRSGGVDRSEEGGARRSPRGSIGSQSYLSPSAQNGTLAMVRKAAEVFDEHGSRPSGRRAGSAFSSPR